MIANIMMIMDYFLASDDQPQTNS